MVAITKDKPLHAHVNKRLTDAEFGRFENTTRVMQTVCGLMGLSILTVPVMAMTLAVMSPKEVSRKVGQEKKTSPSQWYPEEDMVGELKTVVYTREID